MKKQTTRHTVILKSPIVAVAIMMTLAAPIGLASNAYADPYDDRINALQNEISQYQTQAIALQNQATNLQSELDRLAGEKVTIQAKIELSQAVYDKLQQQVKDTRAKILTNQDALGITLADMYVDDTISPLEMLAGSKNIGDYVDKQQYQSSVQTELTKTIATINKLKTELETQQRDAQRTLIDEKNAREELTGKEQERQTLLAQTNGQETAYQQLSKDKQKQADTLRTQQIAANMRAAQQSNSQTIVSGVAGGGGYPAQWANAPIDSLVDSWSLYNRECVSYVAWKLSSVGKFVPKFNGQGNANQWESYVQRYGITSGSEPVVGSAAVLYVGTYGHVMFVESVSDDKSRITVSEYNYGWTGLYSKRTISSANLRYIYF